MLNRKFFLAFRNKRKEKIALLKPYDFDKLPIIGGDSACPPELPLRCAMVLYYFSGIISQRDATAAGGGAVISRSRHER